MFDFIKDLFSKPAPVTTSNPFGWKKDEDDNRDHRFSVPESVTGLPGKVDLRPGMPPVYDQGHLGSCTANAIAAAIEFDRIKLKIENFTPSRLWIYYQERVMEGTVGQDAGAQIRDGIKVINRIGAPSETTWPYVIEKFTRWPGIWAMIEARKHPSVSYAVVPQTEPGLKGTLAAGFPVIFGFLVYPEIQSEEVYQTGVLPMPGAGAQPIGGHAVIICGYDDATRTFLVRNSWGTKFGQGGYMTVPYDYVLSSYYSSDFWTLTQVR